MRTTIVIDDAVFRQARKKAVELKTTLSELVERSLRSALEGERSAKPKKAFKLVVNKKAKLRVGLAWESVAKQSLGSDPNGIP